MREKKHRLHDIVLGMVIMALVMGLAAPAFATVATNTLQAHYMNIKLVIDGVEVTPKDAGGNVVEPFVVDGTTFLPVRAVGEALGKKVTWDGNTKTVYLGEVPEGAIKDWVGTRDIEEIMGDGLGTLAAKDLPAIAKALEETDSKIASGESDLTVRPKDAFGTAYLALRIRIHDYPNGDYLNPRYEYCITNLKNYVGKRDYPEENLGYLKVIKAILEEIVADQADIDAIYKIVEEADKDKTTAPDKVELNTVVVEWGYERGWGVKDLIVYNKLS